MNYVPKHCSDFRNPWSYVPIWSPLKIHDVSKQWRWIALFSLFTYLRAVSWIFIWINRICGGGMIWAGVIFFHIMALLLPLWCLCVNSPTHIHHSDIRLLSRADVALWKYRLNGELLFCAVYFDTIRLVCQPLTRRRIESSRIEKFLPWSAKCSIRLADIRTGSRWIVSE